MKNKSKPTSRGPRPARILTERVFQAHHRVVRRKKLSFLSLKYCREMFQRLERYQVGATVPYQLALVVRQGLRRELRKHITPQHLFACIPNLTARLTVLAWILEQPTSAPRRKILREILAADYWALRRSIYSAMETVDRNRPDFWIRDKRARKRIIRNLGRFLIECTKAHIHRELRALRDKHATNPEPILPPVVSGSS